MTYSTVLVSNFCAESRLNDRTAVGRARTVFYFLVFARARAFLFTAALPASAIARSVFALSWFLTLSLFRSAENVSRLFYPVRGSFPRPVPRGPEAALRSYLSVPRFGVGGIDFEEETTAVGFSRAGIGNIVLFILLQSLRSREFAPAERVFYSRGRALAGANRGVSVSVVPGRSLVGRSVGPGCRSG